MKSGNLQAKQQRFLNLSMKQKQMASESLNRSLNKIQKTIREIEEQLLSLKNYQRETSEINPGASSLSPSVLLDRHVFVCRLQLTIDSLNEQQAQLQERENEFYGRLQELFLEQKRLEDAIEKKRVIRRP